MLDVRWLACNKPQARMNMHFFRADPVKTFDTEMADTVFEGNKCVSGIFNTGVFGNP